MPGNMKPEQMMRAYVDNKIAPIDATLDDHASQLADNADNAALWRAKDGNPATIYPVPKSRLYPRIELVATQEGEGDPSPENIRPIVPSLLTGQKVKVAITDGADYDLLTAEQDFYGLPDAPVVVDAEAGTVTVRDARVVLTGEEAWIKYAVGGSVVNTLAWIVNVPEGAVASSDVGAGVRCNRAKTASGTTAYDTDNTAFCISYPIGKIALQLPKTLAGSVAEFKAYLAAEYANGTPYIVQYQLATPITIPITPPVIAALERLKRTEARQNVLTVTANDSTVGVQKQTVTYQKSPIRESDEIAAAIAALD